MRHTSKQQVLGLTVGNEFANEGCSELGSTSVSDDNGEGLCGLD